MELLERIAIGAVLLPVVGLAAFVAGKVAQGLIDYYAEGLAVLVRSIVDIHGEWPSGEEVAGDIAKLAMYVAGAAFAVTVFLGALVYPQVRWLPEGTAALTFVVIVMAWIPSAFLQHVFGGKHARRRSRSF